MHFVGERWIGSEMKLRWARLEKLEATKRLQVAYISSKPIMIIGTLRTKFFKSRDTRLLWPEEETSPSTHAAGTARIPLLLHTEKPHYGKRCRHPNPSFTPQLD